MIVRRGHYDSKREKLERFKRDLGSDLLLLRPPCNLDIDQEVLP